MRWARRFLPVLLLITIHRAAFAEQAINWETSIDAAKATAARSNRYVLLFFTADWCTYCHRLENDLRNQPGAVTALEANFVPVKLNADYFRNIAQQYGVTKLPTTIVLAPTQAGEVLVVIPEAMRVDLYLQKLNGVVADARRRAAGAYAQIPASPAIGAQTVGAPAMTGANPLRTSDSPMSPNYGAPRPVAPSQAAIGQPAPAQPAIGPFPMGGPQVPVNMPAASGPTSGPMAAMGPGLATQGNRPMPPEQTPGKPTIVMDGYCPVRLVETGKWQKGDKAFGIIHRGRIYLFAGPEELRRFQASPDRYAAISSGNDVVIALETGRAVAGFREHGAQYDGHVYLFASEATLKKFEANPLFYSERALQTIRPAAQTAVNR
jgi:protein disulfide-isomerase